jgi:hypothetical protein
MRIVGLIFIGRSRMQHDDVEKCIVFGEKLSIPNIIAYVGHV